MSDVDELRASVVAAVQQELNRYSEQVSAEIQRLRTEVANERSARQRAEEQVKALLPAVDARLSRVVDDVNLGLAASVESAARPVVRDLELRQERVERDLGSLEQSVRKFDDQAGRIVAHVNLVGETVDARIDEVSAQVTDDITGRLTQLSSRIDEVSAQAARQQAEVSNVVGNRVDQAEARINERIVGTEARINEEVGQRVADLDAYVGRISAGLDEAVGTLSDRLAGLDGRFAEIDAAISAVTGRLDSVDVDAIDEMKDRVASVAGEVELIRIETDRFKESIGESLDKTVARIVDLETQMQEQHLDVETAVQLERLEEVERAIIALDPSQFVRRDEHATSPSPTADRPDLAVTAPNGAGFGPPTSA
jgi:hypothetical protein